MPAQLSVPTTHRPRWDVPSNWHAHTDLAWTLVKALRPDLIVELGVWKGYSLGCWAQAMAEVGPWGGRVVGVDNFGGDHLLSDLEVQRVIDGMNRVNPDCSIEWMNFDRAVKYFRDGSIGILHHDGYHSEERVMHDVLTWLPKMKPDGVITIHDVNVGSWGAGTVFHWLKERYPTVRDPRDHGLGIVFLGGRYPERVD